MHLLKYFSSIIKNVGENTQNPGRLMDLVAEVLSEKMLYNFSLEENKYYGQVIPLIAKIGFVENYGNELRVSSRGKRFVNLYEKIFGEFMDYKISELEYNPSDFFIN